MINATIDGYLASDPERKEYGREGKSFVKFTVPQSWKDREGKEHTRWIRCTVFGQMGENILKYKAKASYIVVGGELKGRTWKGNDGDVEEWEMNVDRVSYGPRTGNPQASNSQNPNDGRRDRSTPRGYGGGQQKPKDDYSDVPY